MLSRLHKLSPYSPKTAVTTTTAVCMRAMFYFGIRETATHTTANLYACLRQT